MDRLTKRYDTHVAVVCDNCDKRGGCYDGADCAEVLRERLAALEDILFADGTQRITLKRLSELVTAEQDGRLIVRPNCNTCVHKFVRYGHEPCCKCYGNDSIAEKGNYHLTTAAAEAALKEGKP